MLRTILIGIDFAGSDVTTQRLGIQWATRTGATLVGLTIVDDWNPRAGTGLARGWEITR
jgi:hypothetical protein